MSDRHPVPWDDTDDPDWVEKVTSWGWKLVEDHEPTVITYRIQGKCPHCGSDIFCDEQLGIGYGAAQGSGSASGGLPGGPAGEEEFLATLQGQYPEMVNVHCNCNENHDPTKTGCGRHGHIRFRGNIQ